VEMELRCSGKVTTEVMDIKVENDKSSRQPSLIFCLSIFSKSHYIDYHFKINILFEPIARTGNLKPLVPME
jgi:hypothetical protein